LTRAPTLDRDALCEPGQGDGGYPRIVIRSLDPDSDAAVCDAILASLPDWFGMEEGIRECAEAVRIQPGLVAEVDGTVVGFLTLTRPYPRTPEISWLAVHARDRRRGIGRALVGALTDQLRADGDRLLLVNTLSYRKDSGPEYAETRAFYLALGFVPVVELDLYPDNPIQLLALPL
jgi:GNAT superfamily N-acetyltransferase